MLSFLKYIVEFSIIPLNVFWVLIILSVFLIKYKQKLSKSLFISALIYLFLTGTKWIPDLLVYGLERQYNILIVGQNLNGIPILVLGGGSVNDTSISPHDRLGSSSLSRLNEGLRLYKALNEPNIVFSGYSACNGKTQAAITREAAISLGIDEEKIVLLEQPTTTEEEALAFKNTFGQKNSKVILVTSDIHMPRAMYLFKSTGLNPIAAPSDNILKQSVDFSSFWWQTNKNNFDKFTAAMHEYIGLLWAKI